MQNFRISGFCGIIVCCLFTVVQGAEVSEPTSQPVPVAPEDEVRATIREYIGDYNRHDAAALAARWTENGVYEDARSGERLVGREAIRRDFEAFLAERSALSLAGRIDRIRFTRPDVANVTGHVVTASPGEGSCDSRFRAVLVRDGGRWLIDNVTEELLPKVSDSGVPLRDLDFLVGHWLDDRGEARVDTVARWSANRSFLIRSYTVERDDGSIHQGTQIVGWDPREERIRSWMFDSDGSFGDGTWSQSENGWVVKYRQTLADGSTAGGTQIIARLDDNTLSVRSIGQEIAGVTLPSSQAIRVVRANVPVKE